MLSDSKSMTNTFMRNSLNNSVYFILILVHFMVGCRKDPHHIELPIPVDSGCTESWCDEFPQSPELGWNYTSNGVQFLSPCFNPNNPDEFVYIKVFDGGQAQLIKHNIATKQETILLDPMSYGPPQWGSQGWITFVYTNKHIWKIRDDGTELTQVTFGVDDKNPMFNYNGDKIIYYRNKYYTNFELSTNPDLYKDYKMMIIDLNGQEVDSVMAAHVVPNNYYQNWSSAVAISGEEIYFVGQWDALHTGVYQWDDVLDSVIIENTISLSNNTDGNTINDLSGSEEFIYFSKYRGGLYQIDTDTKNYIKIRWGCDTRYYDHLSMSSDGKSLIVQKVIQTPYDNNQSIDVQNEIWLIRIDSCADERILWE